ncbi:MAG: nuclear transport factor 2 family protein [Haliea sp.]|uniref:nuclear transport factor 2 family protein n=1 Tax=Haliea sp. TaxID=1932666 RepID=UPI0032F07C33
MSAEENKKLVEHLYAAVATGDYGPMFGAFAESMVWTIIGSTPISGVYAGIKEIQSALAPKMMNSFEEVPRMIVDRLIADDDHVVVLAHGEGGRSKNGTECNNTYCHVLRLEDGKLVELIEYCDTDLIMKAGLGQAAS